jgi:hypothetical protein
MSLAEQRVMADNTASPSPGFSTWRHDLTDMPTADHLELARMAVLSIFTAIALVCAGLALVGSAVPGLLSIGISPVRAMLLLAAANLLVALVGGLFSVALRPLRLLAG